MRDGEGDEMMGGERNRRCEKRGERIGGKGEVEGGEFRDMESREHPVLIDYGEEEGTGGDGGGGGGFRGRGKKVKIIIESTKT